MLFEDMNNLGGSVELFCYCGDEHGRDVEGTFVCVAHEMHRETHWEHIACANFSDDERRLVLEGGVDVFCSPCYKRMQDLFRWFGYPCPPKVHRREEYKRSFDPWRPVPKQVEVQPGEAQPQQATGEAQAPVNNDNNTANGDDQAQDSDGGDGNDNEGIQDSGSPEEEEEGDGDKVKSGTEKGNEDEDDNGDGDEDEDEDEDDLFEDAEEGQDNEDELSGGANANKANDDGNSVADLPATEEYPGVAPTALTHAAPAALPAAPLAAPPSAPVPTPDPLAGSDNSFALPAELFNPAISQFSGTSSYGLDNTGASFVPYGDLFSQQANQSWENSNGQNAFGTSLAQPTGGYSDQSNGHSGIANGYGLYGATTTGTGFGDLGTGVDFMAPAQPLNGVVNDFGVLVGANTYPSVFNANNVPTPAQMAPQRPHAWNGPRTPMMSGQVPVNGSLYPPRNQQPAVDVRQAWPGLRQTPLTAPQPWIPAPAQQVDNIPLPPAMPQAQRAPVAQHAPPATPAKKTKPQQGWKKSGDDEVLGTFMHAKITSGKDHGGEAVLYRKAIGVIQRHSGNVRTSEGIKNFWVRTGRAQAEHKYGVPLDARRPRTDGAPRALQTSVRPTKRGRDEENGEEEEEEGGNGTAPKRSRTG